MLRGEGSKPVVTPYTPLATYESIAKETTFSPVNDSDLPRLLPLLDAARNWMALELNQ